MRLNRPKHLLAAAVLGCLAAVWLLLPSRPLPEVPGLSRADVAAVWALGEGWRYAHPVHDFSTLTNAVSRAVKSRVLSVLPVYDRGLLFWLVPPRAHGMLEPIRDTKGMLYPIRQDTNHAWVILTGSAPRFRVGLLCERAQDGHWSIRFTRGAWANHEWEVDYWDFQDLLASPEAD